MQQLIIYKALLNNKWNQDLKWQGWLTDLGGFEIHCTCASCVIKYKQTHFAIVLISNAFLEYWSAKYVLGWKLLGCLCNNTRPSKRKGPSLIPVIALSFYENRISFFFFFFLCQRIYFILWKYITYLLILNKKKKKQGVYKP